ncbi:MoaD/ThiS family protein [Sphingobacterium sp. N143]|uniref:MoaD/ThiS family protein n=1 Tax=Sphingobacterium sp. N143 TaxID=2746727 RepID=UPI002574D02A|nr:MoaD/ThiS family protein [Sphingobacterium sp. N143]MDM1296477.1 MoaD/ThiS family protein [Sphingobacterium sp. N143]
MKVHVKTFGSLTDILEKEFETSATDTADLLAVLIAQHQELANRNLLIAVNNTVVHTAVELKENDQVALMPPYSGG